MKIDYLTFIDSFQQAFAASAEFSVIPGVFKALRDNSFGQCFRQGAQNLLGISQVAVYIQSPLHFSLNNLFNQIFHRTSFHKNLFLTSESVTEGHPDKLADQISDGVLDEILRQDPYARVAVESLLTTGQVVVAGEVTTKAYIDVQNIVRGVLKEAGYVKSEYGIDGDSCGVLVSLHEQSPDIALGVSGYRKERPEAVGAGDQGMMFGYASDETPELMPAPIAFAHRVTRRLAQARKSGEIKYLRPDGKSQVTVEYENGSVKRIHTVLVSAQHAPGVSIAKMKRDIVKKIIKKVLPKKSIDSKTKFLVNPTGRFVIGGPAG